MPTIFLSKSVHIWPIQREKTSWHVFSATLCDQHSIVQNWVFFLGSRFWATKQLHVCHQAHRIPCNLIIAYSSASSAVGLQCSMRIHGQCWINTSYLTVANKSYDFHRSAGNWYATYLAGTTESKATNTFGWMPGCLSLFSQSDVVYCLIGHCSMQVFPYRQTEVYTKLDQQCAFYRYNTLLSSTQLRLYSYVVMLHNIIFIFYDC